MNENTLGPELRNEYTRLTALAGWNSDANVERLRVVLTSEGDWSRAGAVELTELAQKYGTFILRNALALAVAMGVEDGSKGF